MEDNIKKVNPYQQLQAILSSNKSSKDLKLTSKGMSILEDILSKEESVNTWSKIKNFLLKIAKKIGLVILFFAGLLIVVAVGLINNTIRLSIYSKRFLIRTMYLVGATQGFIRKPFIVKDVCQKCGICVEVCPLEEKALSFKNNDKTNPPLYDYNKCIRCYCCQEMCPYKAIKTKTPVIGRIVYGLKLFK